MELWAVNYNAQIHCTVFHCTYALCTVFHCTNALCTVIHCTNSLFTVFHCTNALCTVFHCTRTLCIVQCLRLIECSSEEDFGDWQKLTECINIVAEHPRYSEYLILG